MFSDDDVSIDDDLYIHDKHPQGGFHKQEFKLVLS